MNELFKYEENEIRVVTDENGDPWFVNLDVCNLLEYADARQTVDRLDDDEKKLTGIRHRSGQTRRTWMVNEAGLYHLILTSTKPEAKAFRRWVTHEVLPSIRKAGKYGTDPLSRKEADLQGLRKMIDEKKTAVSNTESVLKDLKSEIKQMELKFWQVFHTDPNQLALFANEEMEQKN